MKTSLVFLTIILAISSEAMEAEWEYTQSADYFRAVLNSPRYPLEKLISKKNQYEHLFTFPTFVEITESGYQKLSYDCISYNSKITFQVKTENSDAYHSIYDINSNFMGRLTLNNMPGIYQPDYLTQSLDGKSYFSTSVKMITLKSGGEKLYNQLKMKRHGIYWNHASQILSYGDECSLSPDDPYSDRKMEGKVTDLGGTLSWGYPYSADSCASFGFIPYRKGIRGIVFTMDAVPTTGSKTQWANKIRELTEGDVKSLKKNNELLIKIR